jgi:isocitrate lyase
MRSLADQSNQNECCGYSVNPVYRWYNSNNGEYMYCFDNSGNQGGFTFQEIVFQTLQVRETDSVFLFQLYNSEGGYFYTTNSQEVQKAERLGWVFQGNIGYVFTFQVTGTFGLHQFYNSELGQHFYTIHPENENLSNGWTDQGVIGYAFDPNGSTDC